jgi:3'-5' exonuclease
MATAETILREKNSRSGEPGYLVLDTESVPDGRLIGLTRYAGQNLSEEAAVARAQAEARERSPTGSDFLPVALQVPVAVCVLRLDEAFGIQAITCLDAPLFRPAEIVRKFWDGVARYSRARLVTFNGRGFDLPLLELAAFRYRCAARDYFRSSRKRFDGNHLDLLDWLNNFGACHHSGGLDLLAKLLGKPGKMGMTGDQVYDMHRADRVQEINDYCAFDTIDTYFVFLRTRVLTGELKEEQEQQLVEQARTWLGAQAAEQPALRRYLDHWGEWQPWP